MPKNKAPIARLGTPVISGLTVTIDGYTSADPDGTIRRWKVTWGDDHHTEGTGHPGVVVHIYDEANDYDIVLTVFDKKDVSTSTTVVVTVGGGGGPIDPPPPGPVDCVLGPWSAWTPVSGQTGLWSPCFNNSQSRTEERTRNIVVAPANGGVPCDPNQRETRTATQACTPPPPTTGVLSSSNFTFLGNVFMAAGGGNFTGRNESGQITLYSLSSHSDNGGQLYATPYTPGQESMADNPPVLATLPPITWPTWNDNTQLNISYVYPSGTIRSIATTGGNPWPFLGLCYHAGLLYITYLDYYNSAYGGTDHCMVVCDLTQSGPCQLHWPLSLRRRLQRQGLGRRLVCDAAWSRDGWLDDVYFEKHRQYLGAHAGDDALERDWEQSRRVQFAAARCHRTPHAQLRGQSHPSWGLHPRYRQSLQP